MAYLIIATHWQYSGKDELACLRRRGLRLWACQQQNRNPKSGLWFLTPVVSALSEKGLPFSSSRESPWTHLGELL